MPWVVALILGLLWALAVISSYTFGGYVHLLIVAAALVVAYRLVKNRLDRRFKKGV
jgi:hypothetical protein